MPLDLVHDGAILSEDGLYRYLLIRQCKGPEKRKTMVIMVNPSTADATTDDATIRKVRGFADKYLWGKVYVVNLFAYRATDIKQLAHADDPIGPSNDLYIEMVARECQSVVVAWGNLESKLPRDLRDRWKTVSNILRTRFKRKPVFCLDTCNNGHPYHPLMIGYDHQPRPWEYL